MKPAPRIVRWTSTVDASRSGIEIANLDPNSDGLEAELDRALRPVTSPPLAFVIARFSTPHRADMESRLMRRRTFVGAPHVCLALRHESVRSMDPELLRANRFAVLLDDIDEDTPLSALRHESIEAVRFDLRFVEHASTESRRACILETMLNLARDFGLATLGAVPRSGQSPGGNFDFDYIAAPEAMAALAS
jgi:hypothetical protein